MAKKKKTQLKPVARGFATTSVPKKVTPVEAPEPESNMNNDLEQPVVVGEALAGAVVIPPPQDQFDPEKVDEQSLQNLVDKLQERTEKEIIRTVKSIQAIEADRRFSQGLPRLELDPTIVDRILDLVLDTTSEAKKVLEEPEDKAIARLGITYGVLRRLGISESRVEECLRNIQGIDLEEAIEWLYLHCPAAELEDQRVSESLQPKTPSHRASRTPGTPRTPADFLAPPTPTPKAKKSTRLDASAPTFIPSHLLHQSSTDENDVAGVAEDMELDLRMHSFSNSNCSSTPESGRNSPVSSDPAVQYAQLRLRLEQLSYNGKPDSAATASEALGLRKRLTALRDNYFFDDREAEAVYQTERDKATTIALRDKLRGNSAASPIEVMPAISKGPKKGPPPPINSSASIPSAIPDIFDEENDDLESGGLFDILDDAPTANVNVQGKTIRVRDMALPKHWSGRTPKALLQDTIVKTDRYAAIGYSIISGASRFKRAAISIRWEGKKKDEWSMEDVACHDDTQAEQYIATLALHALTFPPAEGFASSSSSTLFRSLPAVYRDLWDELETARRHRDDTTNRNVWAKLRSIIEPKLAVTGKVNGKTSKQIPGTEAEQARRYSPLPSDVTSDQLAASFRARQSSIEYQDMLVQRNALPIAAYRGQIVDMLEESQVIVLSGETGCCLAGDRAEFTVPSPDAYLLFPLLNVGVSRELGDPANAVGTINSLVGYSIRLESNTSRNTRLAYVTNGIALRMLEGGTGHGGQGTAFDEITFFGDCPMLHVPGRTFPVDVRYLEDAIQYTGWSISENSQYARRLHDKFYQGKARLDWSEELTTGDDDEEDAVQESVNLEKRYSPETAATINIYDERLIPYDLIINLLERISFEDPLHAQYSAAVLIFMPGLAEIRRLNDMLTEHQAFGNNQLFKLYPLHSTLSSEDQSAVFDVPPAGVRKIVIATNIAETGITIPDITCVIDTGKHREMRFDEKRQISRLVETFIAKSNAAQRRGRAGRVRNGICFHLFTKLRHDTQMADNPLPEMMRLSLSDLALRIKIMKVKLGSSIEDVLSRALDPPASINVQRAVSVLVEVGALTASEEITPMGRLLSKLPTDVHLGKFLLTATLFRCLDPALTIAAALNSKSPFITPFGFEQEADRAKQTFRSVDKAVIRELSRVRYGRNKTRFVTVPSELDTNSSNIPLINAALTAGLFPKILAVDSANGQMRTITNNQHASFHPSSINIGKKPTDFGVNHLAYFTLMLSKRLYAWETGPVDDMAMLLLCGECDFKLISDSASIDRKIKFRLPPKSNVALKFLRTQLWSLLAHQFRGKPLTESQTLWNDVAISVLGKMKPGTEV
ncbi:hypothetical protein H0H92_001502 [Tricholoma furcatifolium]|nr:hypothetical protein H0H92_001502 [Tricholoma furcatifolium]